MHRPRLVDVPGDGDCFLHAVAGAASDAGVFETIAARIGASDADSFVDNARRAVAARVRAQPDAYVAMHRHIQAVRESDPSSATAICECLPAWQAAALERTSDDPNEFVRSCAAAIAARGNWFGELEVDAFVRLTRASIRFFSVETRYEAESVLVRLAGETARPRDMCLINLGSMHWNFVAYRSLHRRRPSDKVSIERRSHERPRRAHTCSAHVQSHASRSAFTGGFHEWGAMGSLHYLSLTIGFAAAIFCTVVLS